MPAQAVPQAPAAPTGLGAQPPVRPPMDSEPPTGIAPPPLSAAMRGSASMKTSTGLAPSPWDAGEPEDESTKVGAPTDEVLRAIADADSSDSGPPKDMGGVPIAHTPPPPQPSPVLEHSDELSALASAALGARPPTAQPPQEEKRESSIPPPPDSGGTLMMVAPGAEAQHQQRIEYEARIAEEQAEKQAGAGAFPQAPPPFQAQVAPPPGPRATAPQAQVPAKRAPLNSTLAMAPPIPYPAPHTSQAVPPPASQQIPQPAHQAHSPSMPEPFSADGPFGAPITPVSPSATSQIHGMPGAPGDIAMPQSPLPQGDGSSITAWAPLVPLTPGQGGAVAPPLGTPPQQAQGGATAMPGAPFPAHFNNPGARPSMMEGGALPPLMGAGSGVPGEPQGESGGKKLPIVPIAAGAGLLAVIGIVLLVVALKATKAPNPDGTASASAESASAVVPVPVPATVDTAPAVTAMPSTTASAIEIEDASVAPVAEDDASAAAASASASASASAPPTVATAPTAPAPPSTLPAPVVTATPPPPTAVASAKPAADPNAFNEGAARGKLAQANGVLAFCKKEGGVTGPGNASVTFAIDGSVAGVALDPPYAGTSEGNCVSSQFRRAKVNPFTGAPQTIRHSFEVPK